MLYEGLDIYQAKVEDLVDGIFTISLVDYPAVERDFVCFKDEKKLVKFSIESEEKHNITGVVMLANSPIYRRNGDYEYWIEYSPETIEKMANKLLKDGFQNNVSIQHNGQLIGGISMQELYIKDSAKGIAPNFIEDIPDGSLMATFHIDDEELWDEIKNGDALNGFSLEGFFTVEKMNKQNKKETIMNKIVKLVQSLMKFGSIETDKATLYWEGDGELETGLEVYIENTEGLKEAASDGEYAIEDKIIVVEDGKISAINDKEEETEDSVEDEIAETAEFSKFSKIKAVFEESYEEKERQIAEAIRDAGYPDSYVIEAGDDYAVAEIWDEEAGEYKSYRFGISWSEDGEVIVGEAEEVKPAFVPVDTDVEEVAEEEEKKEEEFEDAEAPAEEAAEEIADEAADIVENDYEDRIKALEDALKALEDRIAALEGSPAADTIEEEFEAVNKKQTFKGNKAAKLLAHLN